MNDKQTYTGTSISDLKRDFSNNIDSSSSYSTFDNGSSYDSSGSNRYDDGSNSQYQYQQYPQQYPSQQLPQQLPQQYPPQQDTNTDYSMDPNYLSIIPDIPDDSKTIFWTADKKKDIITFFLIVILFVILSQPFVIKFFSQIIKLIVPVNGRVSNVGLFVYGSILALSVIFLQRFIYPLF